MDRHGVATAISSVTVPAEPFYDGTEKSRSIARGVNEYGAKMVVDYPGRFGLFAALPMPDIEGSLKEIEYSFDTLKADGICIFSSTPGKWPGDPFFHPTWEELNRRKAVVFIHPTTPNCCKNLALGLPDYMLEFDFDTTRAVASLLVNGVLTKYPDIRWIVNHSGACVPVLAGRIQDRVVRNNPELYPTGLSREVKEAVLRSCARDVSVADGRHDDVCSHVADFVRNRFPPGTDGNDYRTDSRSRPLFTIHSCDGARKRGTALSAFQERAGNMKPEARMQSSAFPFWLLASGFLSLIRR